MKPRIWQLITAAVAVVVLAANPAAAQVRQTPTNPAGHPAIPGGFASWSELFAVQAKMDGALAAVEAAANAHGQSGFGSAIAAPENRELRLYWKGAVPAAVQNVIDEWQHAVPIRVLAAEFTREQMHRAQELLMKQTGVTSTGPAPDASGLVVHVRPGTRAEGALAQRLSAAPTDVTVVADGSTAVQMDRYNDRPAYYAGARFWPTSGGVCTAGFAVRNSAGVYMFTAGHCLHYSASPAEIVHDGGGDQMGTTYRDNDARDIGLIATSAAGVMWDGGISTTTTKPVQGVAKSAVGNWLCTSGAATGTHCGIQVRAIDLSYTDTGGGTHSPMVMAEQVDHTIASGGGDSGGPVFSLPSPDNGKVIAKGIISGGDYATSVSSGCPGGITCTWRLYYADMQESLGWYGLTLITG